MANLAGYSNYPNMDEVIPIKDNDLSKNAYEDMKALIERDLVQILTPTPGLMDADFKFDYKDYPKSYQCPCPDCETARGYLKSRKEAEAFMTSRSPLWKALFEEKRTYPRKIGVEPILSNNVEPLSKEKYDDVISRLFAKAGTFVEGEEYGIPNLPDFSGYDILDDDPITGSMAIVEPIIREVKRGPDFSDIRIVPGPDGFSISIDKKKYSIEIPRDGETETHVTIRIKNKPPVVEQPKVRTLKDELDF